MRWSRIQQVVLQQCFPVYYIRRRLFESLLICSFFDDKFMEKCRNSKPCADLTRYFRHSFDFLFFTYLSVFLLDLGTLQFTSQDLSRLHKLSYSLVCSGGRLLPRVILTRTTQLPCVTPALKTWNTFGLYHTMNYWLAKIQVLTIGVSITATVYIFSAG